MYTWLVPHLYKINGMWNKWEWELMLSWRKILYSYEQNNVTCIVIKLVNVCTCVSRIKLFTLSKVTMLSDKKYCTCTTFIFSCNHIFNVLNSLFFSTYSLTGMQLINSYNFWINALTASVTDFMPFMVIINIKFKFISLYLSNYSGQVLTNYIAILYL